MASDDRYTVRVTREDGSVTYRCERVTFEHAEREMNAWNDEDGYSAEIVNCANPWYRAEQRAWRLHVLDMLKLPEHDRVPYWPDEDQITELYDN